jgi:hypothetical protein
MDDHKLDFSILMGLKLWDEKQTINRTFKYHGIFFDSSIMGLTWISQVRFWQILNNTPHQNPGGTFFFDLFHRRRPLNRKVGVYSFKNCWLYGGYELYAMIYTYIVER